MENFLDSCVVIHYSNYLGETSKEILKKCFDFIQKKEGKFILCYASLEEISWFRTNIKNIHKAVVAKIKDPEYNISENLDFRSVSKAKQLYAFFKNQNLIKVSSYLQEQRENSNFKIDHFIEVILDEKVIALDDIDNSLISKIHDIISNHADCKILASALQLQKQRKLFLFVTADNDFNENGYSYLKEHFSINYSKEDWQFPKLKNLI